MKNNYKVIVKKGIHYLTYKDEILPNQIESIINIAKETNNYHVIAGAFREPGNAERKVKQLIEKGYDAQILGTNKWNLTQVSYASFNSKIEARKELNTIKESVSSDAWLFIQNI